MQLVLAPDTSSIAAMMPAYLRELTPDGPSEYPELVRYWDDADRFAYLIRDGARDAGFVLVRWHRDNDLNELAEFYMAPQWRRRGLGRAAARAVLGRHPGAWYLQILADNAVAQAFWHRVVPTSAREVRRMAATGRAYSILTFRWEATADERLSKTGSGSISRGRPRL